MKLRFYLPIVAFLLALFPALALSQTEQTGFENGANLSGSDVGFSSPVIADIDGDPDNGLEIAVAGADARVYLFGADGALRWSTDLPNADCSAASSSNKLYSSPAAGDLNNDGVMEIVVGYGGFGGTECGGGIVAIDGATGEYFKKRNLKAYANKKGDFWANIHSVWSTPAIADVNGDGVPEIAVGSWDRHVYLMTNTLTVINRYIMADTVWSSPSLVNIDDDPELEIVIGTDISKNTVIDPPTPDGGYVYALDTNVGRIRDCSRLRKRTRRKRCKKKQRSKFNKEIPFRSSEYVVWLESFVQVVFSSSTMADVIPSNPGLELIIGSGCFFPQGSSDKRGKWFKILDASTGDVLQTLNIEACSSSSAAVGDLNDDGKLEVIVTENGDSSIGGSGASKLTVFDPVTGNEIWSVIPRFNDANYDEGGRHMSPTVADVDGNGSLEVIVNNGRGIHIFRGSDGVALTCQTRNGCTEIKLVAASTLKNTPAIADIDGDGDLEIVAASRKLHAFTNLADHITSPAGGQVPYYAPWPMFRGSASRTGVLSDD